MTLNVNRKNTVLQHRRRRIISILSRNLCYAHCDKNIDKFWKCQDLLRCIGKVRKLNVHNSCSPCWFSPIKIRIYDWQYRRNWMSSHSCSLSTLKKKSTDLLNYTFIALCQAKVFDSRRYYRFSASCSLASTFHSSFSRRIFCSRHEKHTMRKFTQNHEHSRCSDEH